MAKLFEGEVSRWLHQELNYAHKCPDHPHADPTKVDFFFGWTVFATTNAPLPIAPARLAIFTALEAKEVENKEAVTINIFTPNQAACLRNAELDGGLGLAVVNFDRNPRKRLLGRVRMYRWSDVERNGLKQLNVELGRDCPRISGGWDLRPALDFYASRL